MGSMFRAPPFVSRPTPAPSASPGCRPSCGWRRGTGIALGLVALGFYFGAVLRVDYLQSKLLDLHPNPDAAEYYGMARAMAAGEPPHVQIGFERLPARYPPGYSVLMLPWLKLLPADRQILAPFRTSQTMGGLLLCSVWLFYWKQKQPVGAGAAALLLATLPGFVAYSRASMSEISGLALVAWAFMAAYQGLRTNRRKWLYLCAGLLGLAVNVKTQLVLFGPLLVAMAWMGKIKRRPSWLLHCAGVLLVFALGACPIFILNAIQFGSPWSTGYVFWVPEKIEMAFSARHVRPVVSGLARELFQRSDAFTATHLFGTGAHFTPGYLALALIGCAFVKERKFAFCAALAGGGVLAQALFFYYADGRMFLPLIALLVPLATLPLIEAASADFPKTRLFSLSILALFLLAIAGFPTQSGFPPQAWKSQFADALRRIPLDRPRTAPRHSAARELAARTETEPGTVLSTINPTYLNALLPAGFSAAPLDGDHLYSASRSWTYGPEDARRLVRRTMAAGQPVYALFPAGREADRLRLPNLPGYRWDPVFPPNPNAVILRLQPEDVVPP